MSIIDQIGKSFCVPVKLRRCVLTLVAFAILLSFANGAPQMRRHRRQFTSIDGPFYPDQIPWKNSCGIRNNAMINPVRSHRNRTAKPLKGLRLEIPLYINRIYKDTTAVDTDDVVQWFSEPFNSTYRFLAQINASLSHIHLRKRQIETQVFVGAFQYLRWKQFNHDRNVNENNSTTGALENLLIIAKNLLCEIETAINNTGMKMPMILTREAMDNRLTFRNNNRDRKTSTEVDELDSKFAKIRFTEYLHGLHQILKNRLGKRHQHIAKKQKKNPQLKKKLFGLRNTTLVTPDVLNHTNNFHFQNNLKDNTLDLWSKNKLMHRNNGLKHRNRPGPNKHRQNRNQFQLAGLGPVEIKKFRRNNRKGLSAMTLPSRTSSTATSTQHIAPQS